MNDASTASIDWFFNEIEPVKLAYQNPEFAYVLRMGDGGARLVAAQLLFTPIQSNLPERIVRIGNYYAFRGKLEVLKIGPRDLIEQLLVAGEIPAPNDERFRFDRDGRANRAALARGGGPLIGLDPQQRIHYLTAHLSVPLETNEADDWTLRSADPPFSNVQDILAHMALPYTSGLLQVIALPPIVVDATSSIRGDVGQFKIRVANTLPVDHASLGVMIYVGGTVNIRRKLSSSSFKWDNCSQHVGVSVGTIELSVPKASVAYCFACYGERSYHHYWVGDVNASQNPLRTIYEVFDPQFERATELLNQQAKRGAARDHESAVASLLWVLGFAPLHLVALSDAPDVIAVSADGDIVVVECTLSSLKTDNKIQKLVDRTNEIRKALDRSNVQGKTCIPVIVTSKSRAEIEADIEDCTKRGVVVFTQDDMVPGFPSSITPPDSSARFRELKERLSAAIRMSEEKRPER